VLDKNQVIALGVNKKKTHPFAGQNNKFAYIHAEIDALLQLRGHDLSRASMYVFRFHKDGTMALAKPCKSCMQAIRESGVKKVFWTTERGVIDYANITRIL